ncbi:hypothetical protein DKK68_08145 [Bifidobacterium asteroides]|uniref:sensor histidine kinase n=1 Tax=Bifidobacterium asteroides TaxID=1684 RepID=UPI000D785CF8|nr:histidine kinase [Bifidobacterium asteroides]PXY87684.1 hypothetical protein DKK68_08145 [Bifidobacterium asteroides]
MKGMATNLFELLSNQRLTRFVMPLLSLIYTLLYVSAPTFPPVWAGNIPLPVWKTAIGLIGLLSSCLLYWSRQLPLLITTMETLVYVGLSFATSDDSFLIPLVGALYFCVCLSSALRIAAGVGEVAAAVGLVTVSMHAGHMLFLEWSARMAVIMAVVAAAIAVGSYRIRRETQQHDERERIRSEMLARQRDQAISRAQVAGELHDSVGHDLTTIIALTQGFADSVEVEELQEVLKDINQVARDGLADTRQAVRTLVQEHEALPEESDDDGRSYGSRLHTLDELDTVIAHARAAGLAVVSTETGHQRHDPRQDNLCFIISREAITNTLRHASDPSTIVISRDYEQDGTLRISIHDDGHGNEHGQVLGDQQPAIHDHQGVGLKQISEQCRLMGGSLSCGLSENGGWTVEAILPCAGEKEGNAHD